MARPGPESGGRVQRMSARDPGFVAELARAIRGDVKEAAPLARYSTYRIGGPATVVLPASGEDVAAALGLATRAGIPVFALGLGSNVLLPDAGLDALVIRLGKASTRPATTGSAGGWGRGCPRRSPPARPRGRAGRDCT